MIDLYQGRIWHVERKKKWAEISMAILCALIVLIAWRVFA